MTRHLVIVGGGHAHMTTLLHLQDYVERGHRVSVVNPSPYQYYSGMGPGMLGGLYRPQEIRFNVEKMTVQGGGEFIRDKVVRIDAENRVLYLKSGEHIGYDVASFNTGSEVACDIDSSWQEGVVTVKPIVNLYNARCSLLRESRRRGVKIVVVGGGAAGVEISANLWRLLRDNDRTGEITLIGGRQVLRGTLPRVRRLVLHSLRARSIHVREGVRAESMEGGAIRLSDGGTLPYDFAFIAMGVRPSSLFKDSDIETGRDGGLLVNRFLQSEVHPELFGGGDCIAMADGELARVGVYAVRQNPVLHHNLLAALNGGELKPFDPGGSYMLILNMGNGKGIAWKNGWVWNGRLSFLLKDFIDRRFMKKFRVSGELAEPLDDDAILQRNGKQS